MKVKLIVLFLLPFLSKGQNPLYTLSFPQPHTHYVRVEIKAAIEATEYLDLFIPNWTPGSYMIREFGKNVEDLTAFSQSKALRIEKLTKSSWRIYTQNAKSLQLSYKVYAFELSVRTSFVDASQALINGASVFMYAQTWAKSAIDLEIKPHENWRKVVVALPGEAYRRTAENYDQLIDSPIQLGNFETITFEAASVKHTIALVGQSNIDAASLPKRISPIVEAAAALFGSHPCKEYTFIVQMSEKGGGGLEHLNSTVLLCDRNSFSNESGYENFLGLVAHEYFHLWNVKRLRPKGLGPFDYQNEVYTPLLWIAEGFTSYYDQKLLRMARVITADQYLSMLVEDIHNAENSFGRTQETMSQASFDAWVKYYKKNENSVNTSVSYYTFGSVAACLIDLEIIAATEGQKSLDDVLKAMYQEFFLKKNTGYTQDDWLRVIKEVSGKDMSDFFEKHINGTQVFDYDRLLSLAGVKLVRQPHRNPHWGIKTKTESGKLIVSETWRGGSAYDAGISVNDEILAIENQRASESLLNFFQLNSKIGETLNVLVARNGILMEIPVLLKKSLYTSYKAELQTPNSRQQKILYKWMLMN